MFRLSEIIERELDDFIKKFTILVEPVMMILVGLIVGFVAISIIVPIYNISNSLQHA
jgi:type IV pilus assembly protein PilC